MQVWDHHQALAFQPPKQEAEEMAEHLEAMSHMCGGQQSSAAVIGLQDAMRELRLGDEPAMKRSQARVITDAVRPYRILAVNRSWSALCGFPAEEAVGHTFEIVQGPATSRKSLRELGANLTEGMSTAQLIINYRKGGEPFINFLQVWWRVCTRRMAVDRLAACDAALLLLSDCVCMKCMCYV